MAGVRWFFIACLGMLTAEAHAFIDPPVVVPASPTAATPITIEIRNGLCERIYDYTITRSLNPVEAIVHRIPTQLDPLCINPIQTAQIPIGTLPVGTQQLRLLFQIRESMGQPPNPPYLWLEPTVQVAPAGGSGVSPVPTFSHWLAIGLLAIFVLLGAWARRAITPSGAELLSNSDLPGHATVGKWAVVC